jgi:hypothetical protein
MLKLDLDFFKFGKKTFKFAIRSIKDAIPCGKSKTYFKY